MNAVSINARAKINLTLDVLGKRPDGFHEVEMIMQTIELHDIVTIETGGSGLQVITDHPLLTDGSSNIAYRSARLLIDKFDLNKHITITINKRIPVAAGLAGGSTDAAAVLVGMNRLYNLGLEVDQLSELGALLGSDVPFCIQGGTALASGRGEILTPLTDCPELWLVLAKPPIEVSTAEIYKNFRSHRVRQKPKTPEMIDAIKSGSLAGIRKNLANVLESVTLERYPQVSELKGIMTELGVDTPLMSGSGPSVFGFVDSRQDADDIVTRLKAAWPDLYVTVTRTWPLLEGI